MTRIVKEISGIAEEEWKYKRTTEDNWTTGKLTTLDTSSDYVVQLRVKDFQGVWSYPVSIYATNRTDALPIASFGITNREITRYETLEVIDTSYDPYGGNLTSWTWEVYKAGSKIYTGSTPLTTYDELGEYRMQLTVKNDRNLTSETYSRTFTIIEDSIAPEFIAVPDSCDWTQSVSISLTFTDAGGSQFKSYQYAITDSQETPTSWSGEITKSTDTITISQEGKKYLHITARDNAGNVSEDRALGIYHIDNSGPIISIEGDTTNITIDKLDMNLNVTDSLSGLNNITVNNQPVQNGTITFIKNGTYTIVAEDNIGNTSSKEITINNIYYECDAGLEHPIYSSDYESCPICASFEGLEVIEEKHTYNAQKQGVKYNNPKNAQIVEYYNNEKENPRNVSDYSYELKVIYNNQEYKTGLTGTYTIEPRILTIDGIIAKDRVYDGNNYEVEISGGILHNLVEGNPDNIDFKLNGAVVEVNTVGEQTVKINQVDLINNSPVNYVLIQPSDITVNITPKELKIIKLVADNKIYDGTTLIRLGGGELVGVSEGDNVSFILPEYANTDNKNIGRHILTIDEITLSGEDAFNYTLAQPIYGTMTAEIYIKDVYVEGFACQNKSYDGNNIIQITKGNLIGKVDGDDLEVVQPDIGIAESANAGTWSVSIEELKLVGVDKDNYNLIQPDPNTLIVTINQAIGILEIGCDSKKFDREPIEPYIISKNSTSEVEYHFYIAGTEKEIEPPYEIGEYEVIATMETDGNYTEAQSEKIYFTIDKPDEPTIKIDSKIIEKNNEPYSLEETVGKIRYNDILKIRIDISNIGKGSGYLSNIEVKLPKGIELIEDSSINKQYKWKQEDYILSTDIYSLEQDILNEIFPSEEETEATEEAEIEKETATEQESNKFLELELQVTRAEKNGPLMKIQIQATQQDKHGDIIEYTNDNKLCGNSSILMQYQYVDISVKNKIDVFTLTYAESGKSEEFDIYQRDNEIIKAELSGQRIESSIATVKYQIILRNTGNTSGKITNITDMIPKGFAFNTSENQDWKIDDNGNIYYAEEIILEPGEERTIDLILQWDLRNNNIGYRANEVILTCEEDMDQIWVEEGKTEIEETNNYATSEILVSIATGELGKIYLPLALICLVILGISIILIKKYVISNEK